MQMIVDFSFPTRSLMDISRPVVVQVVHFYGTLLSVPLYQARLYTLRNIYKIGIFLKEDVRRE